MLQDVWRSLMCEPAETCMLYQRQVDKRHSSSCIYVHAAARRARSCWQAAHCKIYATQSPRQQGVPLSWVKMKMWSRPLLTSKYGSFLISSTT